MDHDTLTRDSCAPMTFGWGEIVGGAGRAWALFMLLLIGGVVVVSVIEMSDIDPGTFVAAVYYVGAALGWTVLVGGAASLLVMFAGMPLAWLWARVLRRNPSVAFHTAAWSVFGVLVGPLVIGVYCLATSDTYWLTTPLIPISAGLTGVSILYGWWRASRSARSRLPRPEPRSPIGLDQAFADD